MMRLCLSVAILAGMACPGVAQEAKKEEKKAKGASTTFYPLKQGATWVYRVTSKSGEAEKAEDGKEKKPNYREVTMRVSIVEPVGEKSPATRARIDTIVGKTIRAYETVLVKSDGVYRQAVFSQPSSGPVMLMPLPPQDGKTWEVDVTVSKQPLKGTYKMTQVQEVKTRGYKGKAWKVTSEEMKVAGQDASLTAYYAENKGLVKLEMALGKLEMTMELISYAEAKPKKKGKDDGDG